ncbi:hypothetical protein [Halomicrococcus sp. SG-WS-1]|uniref:hypothetical protein n=1 Tax=Halomicrococcus sp. SG-WS-1 TaxID=3439057 RepID=UPI003F7A69B8
MPASKIHEKKDSSEDTGRHLVWSFVERENSRGHDQGSADALIVVAWFIVVLALVTGLALAFY